MESKRTNSAVTVLGGLLGGAALGLICTRRDMRAAEPTMIDKVKAFESRLYADGLDKATTLDQIKREARQTASPE